MFKINLPNPNEMSVQEFFNQFKIVLKAAEKSYEEMVRGIELNENNTPFISFRQPELRSALLEDSEEPRSGFDLNDYYEEMNEIELEINIP